MNKYNNLENLGFKLIKSEKIPELKYVGEYSGEEKYFAHEFIHSSKAKILFLENNDPEMSFTIGFKTLPKDSTGVFHILEHSVLCGSKKFPVKEPFTNLLKSSMQTFLNAMTFPDKTLYPVASTNEKDLYNLIDVYMDAVLFPNIYKNINIFYQEGGHKTLDGFSGVVFNEMTGVYSDPQEHIYEGLMQELFPESCYSFSSGGSPEIIKRLSYEEYLEQHNTNYSLENAYIILYGNLDIYKMFKFLNDNYLTKADEISKWRNSVKTTSQGSWKNNFDFDKKIVPRIIEVETTKENAECGAGFCIEKNHRKLIATKILLNALTSSNESPLKKSLLEENFAADIEFDMLAEVYEPFIIVECKSSKEKASQNLLKLISNKVKKIANDGIEKELIEASISCLEFKLKEKIPECTTGLDYSISILSEWLYDKQSSTSAIKYIDDINWLKKQIQTDYFNKLAKEIFVDNKHIAVCEVIPVDKKKKETAKYTEDEIKEIKETCQKIDEWQTTPDSKEDEAKIPVMKKSDIGKIKPYPKWKIVDKDLPIIHYDIETNEISHINRYYSINNFDIEKLQYTSLISMLLGKLNTKKFNSSQLNIIIQKYFGHLNLNCAFFENINDIHKLDLKFAVRSSCLNENIEYQFDFIDEILMNTQFDDYNKIKTILIQKKVMMEKYFIAAGHQAATDQALTTILPVYNLLFSTSGIGYYKFIKNLIDNFDNKKTEISNKLKEIQSEIFNTNPAVSYAGNFDIKQKIKKTIKNNDKGREYTKLNINESRDKFKAYKIPSDVNYCALVNDIRTCNKEMSGSNITASKIISLEYLWNEVRVKNGAYGAAMSCNRRGTVQFYSYRDPENVKTFNTYIESIKWLQNLNLDDKTLDNFIISTVAKINAPISARSIIFYQDNCYFSSIDNSLREINATEILNTTKEDINKAAKIFEKLILNGTKCVFGGKNLEKLEHDNFIIIDLFND